MTIGLSTTRSRVVQRSMAAVALIATSLIVVGVSGAAAQPGTPEGSTCTTFEVPNLIAVTVPGDHDVVILLLEDGTSASFSNVVDGQVVESPNGSPVVRMHKCAVPEEDAGAPEPVPSPTPEPTPEPTAEPTPEPTAVVPEPTAEPTTEPTTEPAPAVAPATPTPETQVLGRSQERGALAQTGVEAWAVAIVALGLLGAGALMLHSRKQSYQA